MFIAELFESEQKNLVVAYVGRFQPFHRGHKAVYDYLTKKFGGDSVYIVTSNKVELPKSPFSFAEKKSMIELTGIDGSRVVQSTQPYRALELTSQFNPQNTILLFAVSQKDMDEDPRFKFGVKKDGTPTYFQPFVSLNSCQTLDKHGYLVVTPTFDFTVLGQPVRSASEIRAMFAQGTPEQQKQIFTELYGKFDPNIFAMVVSKLGAQ